MKRCFVFVALLFLLTSCKSQEPFQAVFDSENDFTPLQIQKLDSLYKDHERKTSNEIVLVTVFDFGKNATIEDFGLQFGRKHGVGKKDKNNGVVIIFSGNKQQTRIETGLGTEKIFKDEIAKSIIDSVMLPQFRQAKIFEGIWEGSIAIVKFLEKPENQIH